jgi:ISXO2-like transposase domain
LRGYLAAIATFCNEVKGKSALAISRDLGLSYKAAFVLLHKLREAMAEEMKGRKLGGEGKVAEVDGGYFGGYVKPANHVENRRDRRLARNQTGKRKAVVIIRERNGRSLPAVFRTEGQALSFIRSRIAKGTIINADEGSSWDAKRHIALTALARIGPRNFSAACAAPNRAITTISRAALLFRLQAIMSAPSNWPRNRLLLHLPSSNLKQLMPELEHIRCHRGQVLMDTDSSLDHVFFPDNGVVSVPRVPPSGFSSRSRGAASTPWPV